VSLQDQTAFVWGPSLPPFDDVKAKIAKTGKEVRLTPPFPDIDQLNELLSNRFEARKKRKLE
jgi:hypothetical protein